MPRWALPLALALLLLGGWAMTWWLRGPAPAQTMTAIGNEREYPLTPGSLPGWPGVSIGPMRERANDIYGLLCAPIVEADRVLSWVDRLHIAGDRVFVEPCIEMLSSSGTSYWMFGDAWYEATLSGREAQRQLHLRRIDFPDWDSYFNSAVPCGSLLAWWSLGQTPDGVGADVRVRIGSFFSGEVLAGASLGVARLDTDNPGALTPPGWDAACATATFDAAAYGLRAVTLEVPQ